MSKPKETFRESINLGYEAYTLPSFIRSVFGTDIYGVLEKYAPDQLRADKERWEDEQEEAFTPSVEAFSEWLETT
jgi:hypothetical protein